MFTFGLLHVRTATLLAVLVLTPAQAQIAFWGGDCYGLEESPPGPIRLVALAASETFCLGLRANGTVQAWGRNFSGETDIPPGLWDSVAIAAGSDHGLALRANGTVMAWGDNSAGQTDVPPDLYDVVAIAAGGLYSLALRADGSLVGWGSTGYGSVWVPPNLGNVVAIGAGGNHALALRADGRVVAWGDNSAGQTAVPTDLTNALAISAGLNHSLALTATGEVVAWGDNSYGQTVVPAGLGRVISINAGYDHSLALTADGTVAAWGANYAGQIDVPSGLTDVVALAAGSVCSLALLADGAPVITSSMADRTAALGLPVYFTVSAAGALPLHYQWHVDGLVLAGETNATLVLPHVEPEQAGWYSVEVHNAYGAAYSSAAFLSTAPLLITSLPESQIAFYGGSATMEVSASSALPLTYQWHFNDEDLPGATARVLTLEHVLFPQAGRYAVTVGNAWGFVRSVDAVLDVTQLMAWGDNLWGQTDVPPVSTNVVAVAANGSHGLALQADGEVLRWGDATWSEPSSDVPTGLDRVVAVAAGMTHDLALRGDGTVVAWGLNTSGQTNVPAGLVDVVKVAAGWGHSLALKSDGTVVRWGGTGALTNVPPDLYNIVDIAAADTAALALRADGTVAVWGNHQSLTNMPPDLTNAVVIAAGGDSASALTADGLVVVWGGPAVMIDVPDDLAAVVHLDTSSTHHLALRADRSVVAWGGYNGYGELDVPDSLANVAAVAAGNGFSVALAAAGPPFVGPPLPRRATPYGTIAMLRCPAVGALPLSYQWRFNGKDLPGNNDPMLVLHSVTFEEAGLYSVVVSNEFGMATNVVELAVPPLLITGQPRSQMLLPGATATFTVAANSGLPLSYQWTFNGQPIQGATNSTLNLTNVQPDMVGSYAVEVSNDVGSVRSVDASLSLTLLVTWGSNTSGQLDLPSGLTHVIAIESGYSHGLAINADGTVAAWGDNLFGQAQVPSDLTGVLAVAGGAAHSLALSADGRVVAWGNNGFGQCDVPPHLDDVVAIAAGANHSLALRADGTVAGWGDNRWGQADPPVISGAVAIAASTDSSLALRSDGTLVAWGQPDISFPGHDGVQTTHPLTNAVAISGRGAQYVALRADTTAQVWGHHGWNREAVPPPSGLSNLVSVAAGTRHFLALQADGSPVTWGMGTDDQVRPIRPGPLKIPDGLTNVAAIAAGSEHSLALLGFGSPTITRVLPYCAMAPERNGYLHAVATGAQPLSYQWRLNGTDIPGAIRATLTLTNVQPELAGDYSVVVSNAFGSTTSAVTQVDVVPFFFTSVPQDQSTFQGGIVRLQIDVSGPGPMNYQWQLNGVDLPGATSSVLEVTNVQPHQAGPYTVRVANSYGTLTSPAATLVVSQVVAWGDNFAGLTNVPPGLGDVTRMAQSARQVLALKNDGTVVGWGTAGWGINTDVPPGLDQVVDIAVGPTHALALRADGTVVAWGDDSTGQATVPPGLSDVTGVVIADLVNFAITSTGSVVVWGDLYREVAEVPLGLTGVATISVGWRHVLALLMDGSIIAWGDNESGQLDMPFWPTGVVQVLAAGDHSLALIEDGTVVAWGDNSVGQTDVPSDLRDVVSLASSGLHNLALTRTGRVVAWGANSYGQANVPADLENVLAVFADGATSFALRADGTLAAWGHPLPGQSEVLPLLKHVNVFSVYWNCAVAALGDEPPPAGLPLRNLTWIDDGFAFEFTPPRNSVYSIEQSDSLNPIHWTALPLVRGDGHDTSWTDSEATGRHRFYRVRKW